MMNWRECERKWWWPNLRYYPNFFREGLRITTKNLSQNSQFKSRDLKSGPSKYEATVLTTR
jgi:hypothetical protein